MGGDTAELDLMSNFNKYAQEVKTIPDSSFWSGHFDFVNVQSVARIIVGMVEMVKSTEGVKYSYESGEIEIEMDEVQSITELGTGDTFAVLPVEEWVGRAENARMNHLLAMYLRRAADGQILFPRLVDEADVL